MMRLDYVNKLSALQYLLGYPFSKLGKLLDEGFCAMASYRNSSDFF